MIRPTAYFTKFASVKNIVLFFVISLLGNLLLAKFSGMLDYRIPDAYLHYSAEEFYALMAKFSQEEMDIYIQYILALDFIYPVFYSLFLALSIFSLSHKTLLGILPFGILIFDYLENLSVLTLVLLMPSRYNTLAQLAGCLTLAKWLLAGLCLIILLVYSLRYVAKRKFKGQK